MVVSCYSRVFSSCELLDLISQTYFLFFYINIMLVAFLFTRFISYLLRRIRSLFEACRSVNRSCYLGEVLAYCSFSVDNNVEGFILYRESYLSVF